MRNASHFRRMHAPPGPPQPAADTVDGCPPHYWDVNGRQMTCRKCDARVTVGQDGKPVEPAVVDAVPVAANA